MTREFEELTALRERWATRPASVPAWWRPNAPAWFASVPRLFPTRVGTDDLWRRGEVTWGHVLMANNRIWEPGDDAAPGEILWSDDLAVLRDPERLAPPAARYWSLKRGADTSPIPGVRALVAFAKDEHRAFARQRFPPLLSGALVVWHCGVMLYREHLPERRLSDSLLPIVRIPAGDPPIVMALPVSFWTPWLVERHARARASSEA